MGFLYENSLTAFLLITIMVAGGAAWMSGRGIALSWRPTYQIIIYMVLLSAAARFLHFALFEGELLSLYYYLVNFVVLTALCWVGFRVTRTNQMISQYHWLYEKVSPLTWREKQS